MGERKLAEEEWNFYKEYKKEMTPMQALEYLDDIAHGRKMKYDPHGLKVVIERELLNRELCKEVNSYYARNYTRLERKLKELEEVMDIIVNKEVDIHYLAEYCENDIEEYNENVSPNRELSQDDFDLISKYIF